MWDLLDALKNLFVELTGVSRDALHIHIGLIVFLACTYLERSTTSPLPWLIVNRAGFPGGILAWVTLPPIGSSSAHGSAFRPRREVRGRWVRGDGGGCTRRPIREWRIPPPRSSAKARVDGSPRP